MYENAINGADGAIGAIIGMLWVFTLMGAVVVTFAANRREETMRMRVGIEIEAIRNEHAQEAPNTSIANWLDTMRSQHGDKHVDKYLATLKKRRSQWIKTRAERRRIIHAALPHSYRGSRFRIRDESWSAGQTTFYTKVTTDGSLSSGGFEVVSHPLTDGAHHGWIAKVCNALRHITRVDRSTGLHVHVGLRDPEARFGDEGQITRRQAVAIAGRVAWAYAHFTPAFNKLVSSSRHHGQYCAPANHMTNTYPNPVEHQRVERLHHVMEIPDEQHDINIRYTPLSSHPNDEGYWCERVHTLTGPALHEAMYDASQNAGRYYHLNTNSLLNRNFGTVEYRQHQGTTNPVKISNWVELTYQFTLACADETNFDGIMQYPPTLEGLWAFMDFADDDPLVDYYNKRASVLAGSQLIRACSECDSHTCVHYECVGGNDQQVMQNIGTHLAPAAYECVDCGCHIETHNVDAEDMTASCYECDQYVEVCYASGLIASLALGFFVAAPLVGAVALVVGCGIGAMHAGSKKFMAKRSFKKLWNDLASRGGQAAGFAWQKRKDKHVWHLKAPASSVYLKKHVNKHLDKSTVWAMAHTRYATHGVNNKANAHPHFGYDNKGVAVVTLVHNGVVHNHDDVWHALGRKPTGPVDSEAVAAALAVGGIEKVVETCNGSMSLIWSDTRDPKGTLKFWSNGGNPLCAGRLDHPNTGTVVVASTLDILEKSQGSRLKTSWACTVGREYTIDPSGSITGRDIKGSADTAYGAYSWRTYATLTGGGKSKSNKTRQLSVKSKKPKGKTDGNADNCAVVFSPTERNSDWQYEYDDMLLNEALYDAWAAMSMSGFPAIDDYHGYDGYTHEGVRPNGSKYYLPNYIYGLPVDPTTNTDMQVMLMLGDFDPQKSKSDFDFADEPYDDHWVPTDQLGNPLY